MGDCDEPDALLTSLYTNTFDIFSSTGNNAGNFEIARSVEYHLKNLLCTVLEDSEVPQEVIDVILAQFLRVEIRKPAEQSARNQKVTSKDQNQGTLLTKDYPPAYNMAKAICSVCLEKMTVKITQYFNAIIVDAANATQSNGHNLDSYRKMSVFEEPDAANENLADLRKAHRLLRELWRACPDVIINVIPQIEAEILADSIELRLLATRTLGDIAAGIGIAGLPPSVPLDPAAYPLPSVNDSKPESSDANPVHTPASPKPFLTVHRTTYQQFVSRRYDKATSVRAAWVKAASRILVTSAGGIGMSEEDRSELLNGYAQMLRDTDERVRLAAVQSISNFPYAAFVNVLGADGGLSRSETIFSTLAQRFTDRKHPVREAAMNLAACIWGVASRDIELRVESVVTAVGDFPSRLLLAYFTNDVQIHASLDRVLYDSLLPLSFPPLKATAPKSTSQRRRTGGEQSLEEEGEADPDAIRARRILTLMKGLSTQAKQVFLGMQGRQAQLAKGVLAFLKACEDYNGGVVDHVGQEASIKSRLKTYIEALSKQFPEPTRVSQDLHKFADMHSRRDYQLIRFAMNPEYDYKTVQKAIKELTKRIKEGPANSQSIMETILPLLYRSALLVYNRSHVPTIMSVSRSDLHGLGEVAHEILREISARNPEVLKTHIQALCNELQESAPSATNGEKVSAADTLKACSQLARKYPSEISKDRKFLNTMTSFALWSRSPRAAKHAVSIVLTVADRKELHAKDILSKALEDDDHQSPVFLARLATIAQICLLAPSTASAESEAITTFAVVNTLHHNQQPTVEVNPNAWETEPGPETKAKELALKILVNRCRSERDREEVEESEEVASTAFGLLTQLIQEDGEVAPNKDTPAAQRNRLRLAAARNVLKLCSHRRRYEDFVTPELFINVALVVINPPDVVKSGFVNQVKKYLGQNRLNHRWLTVLFLLAFEQDDDLRNNTTTWLKSRVQYYNRQQVKANDKKSQHVMEGVFARLLSMMVHHPNYPDPDSDEFDTDLLDFSKYVVFYLIAVANDDNLSLIFHIAQRIKQTRDNVTNTHETSQRLYVLSDLAQAVIRNYADMMPAQTKGVNLLQTYPATISLPRNLFRALPNHEEAQKIAEKNYLPEETALGLEKLVKDYIKSAKASKLHVRRLSYADKKRKSGSVDPDDDDEDHKRPIKKTKKNLSIRKTPKAKKENTSAPPSAEPSRKSTRTSNAISYADRDSSDDDAEMEQNDQVASSPTRRRFSKPIALRSSSPPRQDEEVAAEANVEIERDDQLSLASPQVEVHEDEDAGDDDAAEQSSREPTPSPLKERDNPSAKKAKAKTKVAPPKKKAVMTPVVKTTRQTRSAGS